MSLQGFKKATPLLAVAALVGVSACRPDARANEAAPVQTVEGPHEIELTNPYFRPWPAGMKTAWSWGELPDGRTWGSTSAVHVDLDGESMWVFERCGANHGNCLQGLDLDPIFKFDSSGKYLESFGAGMFYSPHGLHVDREGNLWATDSGGPNERSIQEVPASANLGHRVVKFSPTGDVLMVVGEGGTAGDPSQGLLTAPTGTVTAPNGDFFIAEGHSEAVDRVSKFSADGSYIMSWGTTGSAPGEFSQPHDIAMDSQGRVFVADRMNYRIQIFDQEGNYIDSWKQFGQPSGLYISPDDVLYVTDSHSWGDRPRADGLLYRKGIRIGNARTGEVDYYIPDVEAMTRANSGAEGVGADAAGNVYGAIVRRLGIEKHTRPE